MTPFRWLPPRNTALAQTGAMFGMDARIALIVAAILTAAGGLTLMSRLERSKVEAAEAGAETLKEALLKYYQQVGINQMPDSLEPLFQNGFVTDPGLRKDPWGNPWYYEHFSSNVSLEGTLVNVQFAAIYSAGKDGVANSPNLSSETDYAEWEPLKDDVGQKISTRDVEMKRKEEYVARAQLIIDKLESAESAAYVEAQGTCAGPNPPAWCSNQDNKNYTQFNYYPVSNLDETTGVVYYAGKVLNKTPYQSGDENDMQQLMADLGLPTSYAKDPWGRTLQYHSNVNGRTDPPFSASICFSFNGANCFQKD
jgi:hypothetical protein